MISFEVNDMTCGHCASAISKAVAAVDRHAKVNVDLANHRVEIDAADADAQALSAAIKDAGYTPVAAGNTVEREATMHRGCCCR